MKKAGIFLLIIYMTFISLGLPDSVLGVAWPTMHGEFGVRASAAGVITMIISAGTIISSLNTNRLIRWFGIGKVVLISVLLTATALVGCGLSGNFAFLMILAIPLGLGAGAIDTSLNDYVALNFRAHHMNWLHAFWGIGATLGPIIMGSILQNDFSWRTGFYTLGGIQFAIVLLLVYSLPFWKSTSPATTQEKTDSEKAEKSEKQSMLATLKRPGVIFSVLSFIFYVGIEGSMGLWGSSFLIGEKGLSVGIASFVVSTYYASLTVGRILSGFLTFRMSNKKILYLSETLLLVGILSLFIFDGTLAAIGFVFTGLGSAAIFPTMLHETPVRFGKKYSAGVMSVQIGLSYVGTILLPPLLGVLGENFSMAVFPICLLLFGLILFGSTYRITLLQKEN